MGIRRGSPPVTELAAAVGMEQSRSPTSCACCGPAARRLPAIEAGRRGVYSQLDTHVAQLRDEAVRHIDHLRMGREGMV
ncbi:hypothetical protein GCM10010289_59090 [Streptomyces violascens]|nr:hypothetical protein GCM10010289_59090 [Streptomyces violascens]